MLFYMEFAAVKPAVCFPWKAGIPAGPTPRTLMFCGKNVEARMVVKKKNQDINPIFLLTVTPL